MAQHHPKAGAHCHRGFETSLDHCMEIALRDTIDGHVTMKSLSKMNACTLRLFGVDLHATQSVNAAMGSHAMLSKNVFA